MLHPYGPLYTLFAKDVSTHGGSDLSHLSQTYGTFQRFEGPLDFFFRDFGVGIDGWMDHLDVCL